MRRPASVKSFFFGRDIHTDDCRPTGGAQCCHPKFSNHRLALLPSALFVELSLQCQLGALNWKQVLPSRTRTDEVALKAISVKPIEVVAAQITVIAPLFLQV